MELHLPVNMTNQPNDDSCGPTCLQAVYNYYGKDLSVQQLLEEVRMLEDKGGTMAVFLANHALRNGFKATIYTYNLQLFDPTWFPDQDHLLAQRLLKQAEEKDAAKLKIATPGYIEFLELGGKVRFKDLTPRLIREYLQKDTPILTGLSSTYLYHHSREIPDTCADDDIHGEPTGHFVVLCGYDGKTREVRVADPWQEHPFGEHNEYIVSMERLMGAILLGVITYDANLLVIEPDNRPIITESTGN